MLMVGDENSIDFIQAIAINGILGFQTATGVN